MKSEINAVPPGLSTRAISRQACARPSAPGMLWMHRFERITLKLASGKLSLRASSLLRSTLFRTPSTSILVCVRASEFPERSLVLQLSRPLTDLLELKYKSMAKDLGQARERALSHLATQQPRSQAGQIHRSLPQFRPPLQPGR